MQFGQWFPKARNRFTYRLCTGPYTNTAGTGQTVSALHNILAPPQWVRLVFCNDQNATWPIDGAAIACTSQVGDGYDAYNASSEVDTTLWQQVTFNNGGQDSQPYPPAAGSTYNYTMPANAGPVGQPVVALSDWMPALPLSPTDSTVGYLVLSRVYSSGYVRYASSAAPLSSAVNRAFSGNWSPGNGTVSPWSWSNSAFPELGDSPYGIQYISGATGLMMIGVGDSIMRSNASTGSSTGFGIRATSILSRTWAPMEYINEGFSGRTTTDFIADGYADIKLFRPQIVLMQTWSANDGGTQQDAQSAFQRAMALADYAQQNGSLVILCTAAPVYYGQGGGNVAFETARQWSNAQVRSACNPASSGVWTVNSYPLLDLDAILGTGADPNAYQAQYDSGDHTHPNDAGCAAVAAVLVTALTNTLGIGPYSGYPIS